MCDEDTAPNLFDVYRVLGDLVRAYEAFEDTIDFWMDEDAWDAIEGVRVAADAAQAFLIEAGYAHLLTTPRQPPLV